MNGKQNMNIQFQNHEAVALSEQGHVKSLLTLKVPEKLQVYGLYVYYVVHICDFGMLRVNIAFCSN